MRRWLFCTLMVPAVWAITTAPALAFRAVPVQMPLPGPQRVAMADCVIVGRVTGIEDKDVEVEIAPGAQQKTKYRIAIVTIIDGLKGAKDVKSIRVGFIPPPPGQPEQPIRPGIRPGYGRVELKVGQEALLLLNKHAKESFYLAQNPIDVTNKDAPNFKKDLEEAKQVSKLLENPMTGLKSKDAKERLLTASLLITQYRGPRVGDVKTEPIDADESKLILAVLAEADWMQPQGRFDQLHPVMLFNQLGLTPKDGFDRKNVRTTQDFQKAFREWLKTNGGTYRIQRFVGGTPVNRGGFYPDILPIERPPIRELPIKKIENRK